MIAFSVDTHFIVDDYSSFVICQWTDVFFSGWFLQTLFDFIQHLFFAIDFIYVCSFVADWFSRFL